ncbi:hypothetical protein C8A06_0453 [Microbacteriaceae bacterium MWH-Ta3]|nr:hypothetical protein C8A06_0453 [Microbacteriaceae bacterium MWH-Ta3]
MTEKDLIDLWNRARTHLVIAQLAPTFLLITTVGLVPAIRESGTATVLAAWGILLASGILGALVEFSAAHEAQAIARDLNQIPGRSAVAARIVSTARWLHVAKFVTPTIFIGIFAALTAALFNAR